MLNLGITFESNSFDKLVRHTNSNCAGLKDGKRSTGGYVFLLCSGLVSYQLKQQAIVALSSTKAEYMAIMEAEKEVL